MNENKCSLQAVNAILFDQINQLANTDPTDKTFKDKKDKGVAIAKMADTVVKNLDLQLRAAVWSTSVSGPVQGLNQSIIKQIGTTEEPAQEIEVIDEDAE